MSEHPGPISRVASSDVAPPRLISLREVEQQTSLSRSTLYELIRNRKFPAQIRVTKRRIAWIQSEVVSWIDSRVRAGGMS